MASGSTTATESSQTASRRKPTPRLSILITQSDENAWKQLSPTTVSAELASSRPSRSVLTSRVSQLEEYFSSAVDTTVPESSGVNSTGETKTWAIKGLDMLGHIRSNLRLDVIPETESPVSGCSPFSDHDDVIPDPFPEVSQSRKQSRKLSDHIDIHKPLDSIPTLRAHLNSLQSRLSSLEVSLSESVAELPSRTDPGNLIQTVKSLETVTQVSAEIKDGEEDLESTAIEIAEAIQLSLNGEQLITYSALPENWKNNPFVRGGYRFVVLVHRRCLFHSSCCVFHPQIHPTATTAPLDFLAILLAQRNRYAGSDTSSTTPVADTRTQRTSIHISCRSCSGHSNSFLPSTAAPTERTRRCSSTPCSRFFAFSQVPFGIRWRAALLREAWSCAHVLIMLELAGKWDRFCFHFLGRADDSYSFHRHISATLATIVFYGFQHHPIERDFFLGLCVLMGLSGTVTPFFPWFNQRKYKV